MNDVQKRWIKQRQKELDDYYSRHYPPTDEESEYMNNWIAKTINQAKGLKDDYRSEVRKALFDVIEPYERKLNNCYG